VPTVQEFDHLRQCPVLALLKQGASLAVSELPTLPILAEASRFLCLFPRLRFFLSNYDFSKSLINKFSALRYDVNNE
jgi:hypothetical protein